MKVHFIWTIGVLSAVVVGLVTYRFGAVENVISYVGFAATISSLILAILAIVYSVFSNMITASNLSDFRNTASEVTRSTSTLSSASDSLKTTADDIRGLADNIPRAIADLGLKVDKQQLFLQESLKIAAQGKSAPLPEDVTLEKKPISATNYMKELLEITSLNGLYSLYICHLALKSERKFD